MTLFTSANNSLEIERYLLVTLQFRPMFKTEQEHLEYRDEEKRADKKYKVTVEVEEVE